MKPHDVARWLQIGDSTVRAWSSEFGEYLSPTAVGGDNRRRDFTLQDRQILAVVKRYVDHNAPREEIHAELKRLQAGDWRELEAPTSAPDETAITAAPGGDMALAFNVERRALLREVSTLQERVRDLENKLDERADRAAEKQEALLRELAAAQNAAREAETLLRLYRNRGRIDGDDN